MKWTVYFMRRSWFDRGARGEVPPNWKSNLAETHFAITTLTRDKPIDVFYQMQSERWSPSMTLRRTMEREDVGHTSMSVGDIVMTEDGTVYLTTALAIWFDNLGKRDLNIAERNVLGRYFGMGKGSEIISHPPHKTVRQQQEAFDALISRGLLVKEAYNQYDVWRYTCTEEAADIGHTRMLEMMKEVI